MEYIFLGIGISVIALLSYLGIKGVDEAIDFEIPFKIRKAESQNTTVPINSPSILIDNKVFFCRFFKMIFPNLSIEPLSLRNWPITQLKSIINPIPLTAW